MIIKGLFELVYNLLSLVLTPINIPDLPAGIQTIFDRLLTTLVGSISLLNVFVRSSTLKLLIPAVIVIINVEHIYDGIMWVLKKLPFVGIE